MENVLIAIAFGGALVAFEVAALVFGSDCRDRGPRKESRPEVGPGHRPVWF